MSIWTSFHLFCEAVDVNRCPLLAFGLTNLITSILQLQMAKEMSNWLEELEAHLSYHCTPAIYVIFWNILCNPFPCSSRNTPTYVFGRHMSTSISCKNPFVNFLEPFFFLLLSHPNISRTFHQMTFYITLLHRGNNPWLTFTWFSYMYWIPPGDTSGDVYNIWYHNTTDSHPLLLWL